MRWDARGLEQRGGETAAGLAVSSGELRADRDGERELASANEALVVSTPLGRIDAARDRDASITISSTGCQRARTLAVFHESSARTRRSTEHGTLLG
jgi:hypothetical protein